MKHLKNKLLILVYTLILGAGICKADNLPLIQDSGAAYIPQVPGTLFGVNNSGQAVGSFFGSSGSSTGYLYSSGTVSYLNVPGAVDTYAFGINDSGQVVGFVRFQAAVCAGTNCEGYLYSGGIYNTFGAPGASVTFAQAINDNGQIVGWYQSGNSEHGFLYSGGSFTVLDVPGALSTVPLGINNAGQIVGMYATATCGENSFLYSQGSFTQISAPTGPCVTFANGVSGNGEIVGFGASAGTVCCSGFTYYSGQSSTFNVSDVGAVTTDPQGISSNGE